MSYIGEIKVFGGNFAPNGWRFCDGSVVPISENEALFQLIGTTYGGDGEETFALPDLRSRIPIGTGAGPGLTPRNLGDAPGVERVALTPAQMAPHSHRLRASSTTPPAGSPGGRVPAVGNRYAPAPDSTVMAPNAVAFTGAGRSHPNVQPFQVVNFIISMFGVFPSADGGGDSEDPFLAEMRLVSFGFAPRGWATCSGQLLPINQNQALFSLLGTNYGGNGQTTFALPDLRGRVPIGRGKGPGRSERFVGDSGGSETQALTEETMPKHAHRARASSKAASTPSPAGAVPAAGGRYAAAPDATLMDKSAVRSAGEGVAHENMQPSLALTSIISLFGVYPSRS